MIDTIIFDGEGVVIDTEGVWDRAQEEFLSRRGRAYDRERIKPLLTGRSSREGMKVLKREYGLSGDVEHLARERLALVRGSVAGEVLFIEGFLDFFEKIRSRYKSCIATAMDVGLLRLADDRLGLSKLFGERIFTLEDVGHRSKPDPALFLFAARALDSPVQRCLVIEDSPLGIEAAGRAGMRSVGLTTTYERDALSKADRVVSSFAELTPDDLLELAAQPSFSSAVP